LATRSDVDAVLDLLVEAAAWIIDHLHLEQWPRRFDRTMIEASTRVRSWLERLLSCWPIRNSGATGAMPSSLSASTS
jgi:hypothetical protein